MTIRVRFSLLVSLLVMALAVGVPTALGAVGIEKFVAVNCDTGHEGCAQEIVGPFSVPKEPTLEEAEEAGYVQAGGRVPFGVTDFKVTTVGTLPNEVPTGVLTHVRTDVAPGLATSPTAVPQCSEEDFGVEELPGTGFFSEPKCSPESDVGVNKVTVYAGAAGDIPLEGKVYNLVQKEGLASEFGVALELPIPLTKATLEGVFAEHPIGEPFEKMYEEKQYFAHILIEGNVEWGQEAKGTNQGDYHDYFNIDISPALPLISSRLVFFGRSGEGDFITNATSCPGHNTTTLTLTDTESNTARKAYTTPVPLSGCAIVPFNPSFALLPAAFGHDEPDGFTAEAGLPHNPTGIDDSQLKEAIAIMPEGMTLNPSAAAGLTACTPAQARIHSETPGVACPASSELGAFGLDVPTLPPGSLSGKIYLGGPESGPIAKPPYTIYLDAESARYGVSVRLKGEVFPDAVTGRLTTVFSENPEQPFTNAKLTFKQGALAPVANPLTCGAVKAEGGFVPFSGTAGKSVLSGFTITGCPSSPLPFAPTQSTADQSGNAGGHTSFTFNLERADGEQYFSAVKTTLPPGLVGAIPAATECPEALAESGECTAASQIGIARVLAGSGATPYAFSGPVYLTGPYNGAPFGLSIVVPAVAGPFNFGNEVARAAISVDQTTAQVSVASVLPRISPNKSGVPLRIRRISVEVNRQSFLFNPTSCAALATVSSVTGFVPGSTESSTVSLSSPFQLANCSALKFKPAFKAASNAKTSKKLGASLETTLNQVPGQANVRSVLVQLPKQLPSRLTTLQKACPEATFAVDPYRCPAGSFVGGVRANTPLLPSKMKGPAILVSHGGQAFPDLDLVLEGDGVRVIVVGNTHIKNGITTTDFASTPDVPVSSITVNLPVGTHSALTAFGSVCARPLVMPTTITGQNGATTKQNTIIRVAGCGVRIVGHKVVGNTAYITVQTFAAGRISASGRGVATVYRHLRRAYAKVALRVPLSRSGRSHARPFRVRLRVGFLPSNRAKVRASSATVKLTFR